MILPKKIVSITGSGYCLLIGGLVLTRRFSYYLNEGQADRSLTFFCLCCQILVERDVSSDIIDDTCRYFVNGFKVVETADKEYAYVREE